MIDAGSSIHLGKRCLTSGFSQGGQPVCAAAVAEASTVNSIHSQAVAIQWVTQPLLCAQHVGQCSLHTHTHSLGFFCSCSAHAASGPCTMYQQSGCSCGAGEIDTCQVAQLQQICAFSRAHVVQQNSTSTVLECDSDFSKQF